MAFPYASRYADAAWRLAAAHASAGDAAAHLPIACVYCHSHSHSVPFDSQPTKLPLIRVAGRLISGEKLLA